MQNIKWLFFDLGSTLIDESKCIKKRCDIICESNNIDREKFIGKITEYAKTNSYAVKAAASYYGVDIPRWFGEFESPYPNVPNILEALSEKYKLGIIANQVAGTKKRIDNWGIGKYFDVVVASAEAGCAKPDLKIFNMALEEADCNPDEAVMIGDRIDNDILPAKKLEMKTVWVRQGFAKYQNVKNINEKIDYIINDISQITTIFY